MAKQEKNGSGNSAGRKLTVRNAPCYLFTGRWRVKMTETVLPGGSTVTCGETRKAKNKFNRTMRLVVTNFIVLPSRRKLWVESTDLADIRMKERERKI